MYRKAFSDMQLMVDLLPDERDRQIVAMRYGLSDGKCMSFPEIARALPVPVSQSCVRANFVKAMDRLQALSYMMEPAEMYG